MAGSAWTITRDIPDIGSAEAFVFDGTHWLARSGDKLCRIDAASLEIGWSHEFAGDYAFGYRRVLFVDDVVLTFAHDIIKRWASFLGHDRASGARLWQRDMPWAAGGQYGGVLAGSDCFLALVAAPALTLQRIDPATGEAFTSVASMPVTGVRYEPAASSAAGAALVAFGGAFYCTPNEGLWRTDATVAGSDWVRISDRNAFSLRATDDRLIVSTLEGGMLVYDDALELVGEFAPIAEELDGHREIADFVLAPTLGPTAVIAHTGGNGFAAFDPQTGDIFWDARLPVATPLRAMAATDHGIIVAADDPSGANRLLVLDESTGEIGYEIDLGGRYLGSCLMVRGDQALLAGMDKCMVLEYGA